MLEDRYVYNKVFKDYGKVILTVNVGKGIISVSKDIDEDYMFVGIDLGNVSHHFFNFKMGFNIPVD